VKILKEEQFIKINSNIWRELEELSAIINKKGVKALPSKDVKSFLHVFRQCSHHLAYARTHYPQSNVVNYLNSLVGKCHNHVYSVQRLSLRDLFKYISHGFPKLLKDTKWFVVGSFGFFALGFIVSLLMVFYNTGNAAIFLPDSFLQASSGGGQATGPSNWNYPLISSQIMVNNISVCLRSFVFGITLGLGTIYVLFYNGAMLGALTALMYMKGDVLHYWSLILPHGVIELTAIFISGAAGLIIAKSMLIPGEYSRKHSLIHGTKKAVSLLLGIVIMLIIAGIIEGFFTPLNILPITKLIFAAVTAVLLSIYFAIPYLIKRT
jgi:uncharacterized membrane protein SpoIIM required for sporulation